MKKLQHPRFNNDYKHLLAMRRSNPEAWRQMGEFQAKADAEAMQPKVIQAQKKIRTMVTFTADGLPPGLRNAPILSDKFAQQAQHVIDNIRNSDPKAIEEDFMATLKEKASGVIKSGEKAAELAQKAAPAAMKAAEGEVANLADKIEGAGAGVVENAQKVGEALKKNIPKIDQKNIDAIKNGMEDLIAQALHNAIKRNPEMAQKMEEAGLARTVAKESDKEVKDMSPEA